MSADMTAPGSDPRHGGLIYRDERGEHLVLAVDTTNPAVPVFREVSTENIGAAELEVNTDPWNPDNEIVQRQPTEYEMALVGAFFEAAEQDLVLPDDTMHDAARHLQEDFYRRPDHGPEQGYDR